MVALNFDATAVPESTGGFELIQPGEHRAMIVAEEVKESKQTPGNTYLELQVKIEGLGSVWDKLFLWYSNPKAVEMANGTLKEIAHAIGKPTIGDSTEMLMQPLMVRVDIEAGTNGYSDKNVITRYMPVNAAPAPVAQLAQPVPPSAPSATAAPAQATTGQAPWQS
tara:strand:+ start:2254 stop:2751 length:498 start_codon:yes stop_codon:yes gene_type:complete